jgi:hypothetical protein
MIKQRFTSLEAAHRFYVEQSMQGKAATLETVVPCREWLVIVYAS